MPGLLTRLFRRPDPLRAVAGHLADIAANR